MYFTSGNLGVSLVVTRPFLKFTQQLCHLLIFAGVSNITLRVRLEGSRINHACAYFTPTDISWLGGLYRWRTVWRHGRCDGSWWRWSGALPLLRDCGCRPGRFGAEPDNSFDGTLHCWGTDCALNTLLYLWRWDSRSFWDAPKQIQRCSHHCSTHLWSSRGNRQEEGRANPDDGRRQYCPCHHTLHVFLTDRGLSRRGDAPSWS